MTPEEKEKWLMNVIIYHKKLYYSGNAKISDVIYDKYEDDLRKLNPHNPVLKLVGYGEEYESYVTKGEWYSDIIPYKTKE